MVQWHNISSLMVADETTSCFRRNWKKTTGELETWAPKKESHTII